MAKVAIIGAGVLGLSLARELTAAGESVTIFDPQPGQGASAGQSRIFRRLHSDPRLLALSANNRQRWQQWSEQLGQELISADGLLYRGPSGKQHYRALRGAEIAAEWVTSDTRSPLPAHPAPALFETAAGAINSQLLLDTLLQQCQELICTERVEAFAVDRQAGADPEVLIMTANQQYSFSRLVLLCGLGLPELLPQWSEDINWQAAEHLRLNFALDRDVSQHPRPAAFIDHYRQAYGVSTFPNAEQPAAYGLGIKNTDLDQAEQQLMALAAELPMLKNPEVLGAERHPVISIDGQEDSWALYRRWPVFALAAGNAYKWAPTHSAALQAVLNGQDPDHNWLAIANSWKRSTIPAGYQLAADLDPAPAPSSAESEQPAFTANQQ